MSQQPSQPTRRTFLKNSATGVVAGSLAATLGSARFAHAAGSDVLKVGLIGCGGRGRGAAVNAMKADENVQLTALADLFPEPLSESKPLLQRQIGDKYAVDEQHCFVGFDCYQKLIATDVDVVLLCSPPHFRPDQMEACIQAGKHVFCEKPVAVDPVGVRRVLETCELAKVKGLNVVSGLCWRYDKGVLATMQQIQDGAIGDIVNIQENYLTGTLWHRGRNSNWSEMEYQLRNWMYFTWLSGDHIVEQHIHSLDKALWLMGDQPPKLCYGLGGRQARTEEMWGHIYDHFAVCYEWENGTRCFSYTRQLQGVAHDVHRDVEDYVFGTKGSARVLKHEIDGPSEWRYRGPSPSMYDLEHEALFAAIRQGTPINNGTYMSYSTLLAIMGREACYSGQQITWEEALQSEQRLGPEQYAWGEGVPVSVAVPGVTKFA